MVLGVIVYINIVTKNDARTTVVEKTELCDYDHENEWGERVMV